MSRPQGPAPIQLDKARSMRITVPFKFLTYVFGGGVEHVQDTQDPHHATPSRPFDEVTPIRATGVRGQLRFWWRATTGVRCASLQAMRDQEEALWGGVWSEAKGMSPGVVSITVNTHGHKPKPVPVFGWREGKAHPSTTPSGEQIEYGAFPLRPQGNNGQAQDPRSAVWDHGDQVYTLTVDLSDPRRAPEVILAINAWLTVGGYGGRTTRGFGAVALVSDREHTEGLSSCPDMLRSQLKERQDPASIQGVPALIADDERWAFGKREEHQKAWHTALEKLRTFRQGCDKGRNPPAGGSKSPAGRSRWPEADELRRITGQSSASHRVPLHKARAFPRADFGLPIIFHFKDKGEPKDQTLQVSKTINRFPSTLIVRPTSNGQPMAVRLARCAPPKDLFLKGCDRSVRKDLTAQELQAASDEQRALLEPDPISAFLKYFTP